MKLRVTRWRIAAAVVLLPVVYVLNFGPLCYCIQHGFGSEFFLVFYGPAERLLVSSPIGPYFLAYEGWWARLPP